LSTIYETLVNLSYLAQSCFINGYINSCDNRISTSQMLHDVTFFIFFNLIILYIKSFSSVILEVFNLGLFRRNILLKEIRASHELVRNRPWCVLSYTYISRFFRPPLRIPSRMYLQDVSSGMKVKGPRQGHSDSRPPPFPGSRTQRRDAVTRVTHILQPNTTSFFSKQEPAVSSSFLSLARKRKYIISCLNINFFKLSCFLSAGTSRNYAQ
jgi:hypothetical protein